MAKMKMNIFFVNAEFYRVVWTINALLTVRSEMLPYSGNNQKHRNVWSPPEHFSIGYVNNDNLQLGTIALQLCHSKQLQEGLMVFSDDFLHFLKIKKKKVEFTKTLVALTIVIYV